MVSNLMGETRLSLSHLSHINPQVLLLVGPVTNGQAQFVLLAALVQLHLLGG